MSPLVGFQVAYFVGPWDCGWAREHACRGLEWAAMGLFGGCRILRNSRAPLSGQGLGFLAVEVKHLKIHTLILYGPVRFRRNCKCSLQKQRQGP